MATLKSGRFDSSFRNVVRVPDVRHIAVTDMINDRHAATWLPPGTFSTAIGSSLADRAIFVDESATRRQNAYACDTEYAPHARGYD
ncbi:MAG: hypothetical protein M1814_003812 [Vezdaea aestivalis]|nr:MAG: hypothetical protein M1814_003812 [Vezdaea aestivalis]